MRNDRDTRQLLLASAMKHFGEKGFEAASIRTIVAEAGQNVSSIKYHFGSKDDLYDACARAAAERLTQEGPDSVLGPDAEIDVPQTGPAARSLIRKVIAVVLQDALRPDLADETRFLQREILLGGRSAKVLFDTVLRRRLHVLADVLKVSEGLDNREHACARGLAIILQTATIMSARRTFEVGTGWRDIAQHIPDLVDAIYPPLAKEGPL